MSAKADIEELRAIKDRGASATEEAPA